MWLEPSLGELGLQPVKARCAAKVWNDPEKRRLSEQGKKSQRLLTPEKRAAMQRRAIAVRMSGNKRKRRVEAARKAANARAAQMTAEQRRAHSEMMCNAKRALIEAGRRALAQARHA